MKAEDVDAHYFGRSTQIALAKYGLEPSGLLALATQKSLLAITQSIGHGASVRGMLIVLFEDSRRTGKVRYLCQQLLYRDIIDNFPHGWGEYEGIRPVIRITWDFHVSAFAPECRVAASQIVEALASSDAPPFGWLPTSHEDPRLTDLFSRYWPNNPDDGAASVPCEGPGLGCC